MFSMTRKFKNKGTKGELEEQQYYILQWAEDLESTQTKQLDKEEVWIHFFMSDFYRNMIMCPRHDAIN